MTREFQDFCKEWKIMLHLMSMIHRKSNGLGKTTNKRTLHAQYKQADKAKGTWVG